MLRIFSKFQDYYDCTIGSFNESDVVIHRNTKDNFIRSGEVESLGNFDGKLAYIFDGRYGKTFGHKYLHMIGFCGKWYFFTEERDYYHIPDPSTIQYYTFDEIVKSNRELSLAKLFGINKEDRNINYKNPDDVKFWNYELFEKFGPVLYLDDYRNLTKYNELPHRQRNYNFVSWPCLKDYRFQLAKDPYMALWELEHWYDTHARPDDAIVPVGDDITRLEAYGFDRKTSFRKAKTKK